MVDNTRESTSRLEAATAAKAAADAEFRAAQAEDKWMSKPQNQAFAAKAALEEFVRETNIAVARDQLVQLQDKHAKRLCALDLKRTEKARAAKSASTGTAPQSESKEDNGSTS